MTFLTELFPRSSQGRSFAILVAIAMLVVGCTGSDNKNSGKPAGSSASGPTKAGSKRIILLNNTDSPFWDAARAGIKKAQEELKLSDAGFTASMDSNDGTETGQIEKLRQYGTQSDIAAVIISPISSTNPAIADELKKLKAKGITIGCFDSDLDKKFQEYREFYVGTNNIAGGKVLGTAAKLLKPQGASYVQFVGVDSQQNAIERMDGFTSAVGEATSKRIASSMMPTATAPETTSETSSPNTQTSRSWLVSGPTTLQPSSMWSRKRRPGTSSRLSPLMPKLSRSSKWPTG